MFIGLAFSFYLECDAGENVSGFSSATFEGEALLDKLLELLPRSSQEKNASGIQSIIERLRYSGVCKLEGNDADIRPGCVGFQCLLEEMFLVNSDLFEKANFEIHTTMPSTPCCKLPNKKAKETFLASFEDEARLVTIDGRSSSLDAILNQVHATLHLTYTKAGFYQRSEEERAVLMRYWGPKIDMTCVESHDEFPMEVNGATYRFLTLSGNALFFGIQASQALHADNKIFTIHFGVKDQEEIKIWLEDLEEKLASFGRVLFSE